jgi:hypothetical protein
MIVFKILSNKIPCLDVSYEEILNFLGGNVAGIWRLQILFSSSASTNFISKIPSLFSLYSFKTNLKKKF